jgi:hypothetical protein
MTREDMETELRYLRLKMRLHNRAAGSGVVWGLAVGRQGGKVRVEPGYAVDCCGNDLTVTCPYEVDIATLLADPAACPLLGQGPQRLHLLLEYVECPEEPRPVHGDVCSPQTTLCEPSRVRETVRLRLVPPRDWAPDGPIGTFVNALTSAKPVSVTATTSSTSAGGSTAAPLASGSPAPFTVQVTLNTPVRLGFQQLPLFQPLIGQTVTAGGDQNFLITESPQLAFTINLQCKSGYQFTAGKASADTSPPGLLPANSGLPGITAPSPTITWTVPPLPVARGDKPTVSVSFVLDGLIMTDASGSQPSVAVRATIVVAWVYSDSNGPLTFDRLSGSVATTALPVAGPWPCLTEACDPQGKPRFPVLPPWSHADPNGTLVPADPKADVLAAVYSLLALDVGRYQDNQQAAAAPDVQLLTRIYEAAWHVLFRIAPDAEGRQLSEALHQLFRDWCCGLLYPGQTCQGDPHGVVVGCALVQGGDICEIDSWGGRRWVAHYPLLAYWLEQFGVTPPDVLASRFFDILCCIADDLRTPPPPSRYPNEPEGSTTHLTTTVFTNQGSHLVFGSQQDVLTRLGEMGVKTAGVRTVGFPEFVRRVVSAFRATQPASGAYSLFTTAGFPNVYLATVDTSAVGQLAAQPGRVTSLVQPVLSAPGAVPPLLRDFATTLALALLNQVPLGQAQPNNPTSAPLMQAGITTVGAVLARSPEGLLQQVLQGNQAKELTALLGASENLALTVAKAVAETIQKHQAAGLLTRSDFTRADLVASFNDDLAKALANVVPNRDAVAQDVDQAARAAPGANP